MRRDFKNTRLLALTRAAVLAAMVSAGLVAPSLALAQAEPSQAFQRHCEKKLAPTRVEVEAIRARVAYDHSLSLYDINARNRQATDSSTTLGLTEARLAAGASWNSQSMTDRNGVSCLRPQLKLQLYLEPHLVYVAREFARGSCEYNAVMKHENTHVQINEAKLDEATRMLRNRLRSYFGNQVFYGNLEQMRAQLHEAIKTYWLPLGQEKLNEANAVHEAFDSPEEYARSSTVCGGAISRIVRASRVGW